MNHDDQKPAPGARKGRRWLLAGAAAAVAGALSIAGASFADDIKGMHGHHFGGHHGPADPAAMAKHIDQMFDKVIPGGTPEQREKINAIARAALNDVMPAHERFQAAHTRAHELLTAPVIDRAALEQLRAGQMRQMDVVSRRLVLAAEDAAETLTPEQRVALAEHIKQHMQ